MPSSPPLRPAIEPPFCSTYHPEYHDLRIDGAVVPMIWFPATRLWRLDGHSPRVSAEDAAASGWRYVGRNTIA